MSDQQLFKDATAFLPAYTEHGLSIYSMAEALYVYAALVEGLKTEFWLKPADDPIHGKAFVGAWYQLNLMDKGQLTTAGKNMVACKDLVLYEWNMTRRTLAGKTDTDPKMYEQCRRGLEAYAHTYNPELIEWVVNHCPFDGDALDMCCGDGLFGLELHKTFPQASVDLMDKTLTDTMKHRRQLYPELTVTKTDVLATPIENGFPEAYDFIVLSEAAHCMSMPNREKLYRKIGKMLKPGGVLVVVEQVPNLRMAWRLQQFSSSGGQCLPMEQVAFEGQIDDVLRADLSMTTATHYAIKFVKTEKGESHERDTSE